MRVTCCRKAFQRCDVMLLSPPGVRLHPGEGAILSGLKLLHGAHVYITMIHSEDAICTT